MKCLIQYIIHGKDKYALFALLNYVNMIITILWQEGNDRESNQQFSLL